jgi:hypothetical protein
VICGDDCTVSVPCPSRDEKLNRMNSVRKKPDNGAEFNQISSVRRRQLRDNECDEYVGLFRSSERGRLSKTMDVNETVAAKTRARVLVRPATFCMFCRRNE